MRELLTKLKAMLDESKKETKGFTLEESCYTRGQESMLESVIGMIEESLAVPKVPDLSVEQLIRIKTLVDSKAFGPCSSRAVAVIRAIHNTYNFSLMGSKAIWHKYSIELG